MRYLLTIIVAVMLAAPAYAKELSLMPPFKTVRDDTKIPVFDKYSGAQAITISAIRAIDPDATLSANSDSKSPSQKAVKGYVNRLYSTKGPLVTDFYASGSYQETTGSITASSAILTVANIKDFSAGQGVSIVGAGTAGALFLAKIQAVAGNVITLDRNVVTSVSGVRVRHEDSFAFQAAADSLGTTTGTVFVPPGVYWIQQPVSAFQHNWSSTVPGMPVDPYGPFLNTPFDFPYVGPVLVTDQDIIMLEINGGLGGATGLGFISDPSLPTKPAATGLYLHGTANGDKLQINDAFVTNCWFGNIAEGLRADRIQGYTITNNVFDLFQRGVTGNGIKNTNFSANVFARIGSSPYPADDVYTIRLDNRSNRNTFTSNQINGAFDIAGDVVLIKDASHNTFTGNSFRVGGNAVRIDGSYGGLQNKFIGNSFQSFDDEYILLENDTGGTTIAYNSFANEIDGKTKPTSSESDVPYVRTSGTCSGVKVNGNTFRSIQHPAFAPFTSYQRYDYVTYAGNMYWANITFTSGASFSAGDWNLVGEMKTKGIEFSAGTTNSTANDNDFTSTITTPVNDLNGTNTVARTGEYTNRFFGIGTQSPTVPIHMSKDISSGGTVMFLDGYAGSSSFSTALAIKQARGTVSAPTASQSGDFIGRFGMRGYGTTGFPSGSRAYMQGVCTENWTDSANGVDLDLYVTGNGSTTPHLGLKIAHDNKIVVPSGASIYFTDSGTSMTSADAPYYDSVNGTITLSKVGSNSGQYRLWVTNDAGSPVFKVYQDGTTTTGNISAGAVDATSYKVGGVPVTFGGVTSITPGTGFTSATPITTSGTLNVDVGTTNGKIAQYDSSNGLNTPTGGIGVGKTGVGTNVDIDIYSASRMPVLRLADSQTSATGGGVVQLYHNNASAALPSAGDRLGAVNGGYLDSGTTRNTSAVSFWSTSAPSAGTAGTGHIRFETIATAGGTRTERLRVTEYGALRFAPMGQPSSGTEGDCYWDSTSHKLTCYTGSAWQAAW